MPETKKKKPLDSLKITPEQERLYREWFKGKKKGAQVGNAVLLIPKKDKE
jgi:hypothetical protein